MGAAAIAVLPFDNPSGDPDQAYLATGFVEELVTELSRFPAIELIHPTTSFTAAAAELPVTYHLRGSVRRLGDIVRIGAQLVAAADGRQLWAEKYDAPAADLFAVQDEIVARVASVLALEIDAARLHGARRKPLTSLDVYDCWLRGLDCLRKGTIDDDARARLFFERALTLDPLAARAHVGLSLSHFNEWSCQAWERWDDQERLAFDHARRAAELDDRDAIVQIVLGRVLMFRRRFDEAARHVDRAVELNPNDADVLAHAGMCVTYLGDAPRGLALAQKAIRLNPRHPAWYVPSAGIPLLMLGRAAEAAALFATAPQVMVDVPAWLAASHALAGDAARADEALAMFHADFVEKITFGRAPEPGEPLRWILHVNPFRRREDADLLIGALARGGVAPDPDEARAVTAPAATFRRAGERWTVAFGGVAVELGDAKGFHDLALLLAQPEGPIHCLELAGRSAEPTADAPVLDAQARRELGARVRLLEETIEEADARHDRGRAEAARGELDRIVAELSSALGLGGRSRPLGSAVERARSAVTWRIRNAIRKLASAHPALGKHLDHAVRTGTYCAYEPETPVEWSL